MRTQTFLSFGLALLLFGVWAHAQGHGGGFSSAGHASGGHSFGGGHGSHGHSGFSTGHFHDLSHPSHFGFGFDGNEGFIFIHHGDFQSRQFVFHSGAHSFHHQAGFTGFGFAGGRFGFGSENLNTLDCNPLWVCWPEPKKAESNAGNSQPPDSESTHAPTEPATEPAPSLGELARKWRAGRNDLSPGMSKIYTNDNLPRP